ncbi:MAG: hypothetical protein IJY65_05525 [Clostridia bacterium]|nr:hypothetical protein [Clostridia bacterium]
MSSVNYSLKHKGVKLISSDKAWTKSKSGKRKLNSKYQFVGKIDTKMPNLIISAAEGKPKYKGNTHDLCAPAKRQIVEHFFDDNGKRNRKTVAYFGIEKQKQITKRGKN